MDGVKSVDEALSGQTWAAIKHLVTDGKFSSNLAVAVRLLMVIWQNNRRISMSRQSRTRS